MGPLATLSPSRGGVITATPPARPPRTSLCNTDCPFWDRCIEPGQGIANITSGRYYSPPPHRCEATPKVSCQTTMSEPTPALRPATGSTGAGLVRLMRPHQWVKNGFVLAPLVFVGQFMEPASVVAGAADPGVVLSGGPRPPTSLTIAMMWSTTASIRAKRCSGLWPVGRVSIRQAVLLLGGAVSAVGGWLPAAT